MQEIPEALQPLSWLGGRWSTKEGKGIYPNIPDFSYHEELEFICIGQPMFNYLSLSRHPEKQTPMHQERGFLRVKPQTNQVAFIVSHNFGLTSVEEGIHNAESKEIVVESVNITRMSFAKPPYVKKLKRVLRLIGTDTLEITLYMETDNTPLTLHSQAVYKKISE